MAHRTPAETQDRHLSSPSYATPSLGLTLGEPAGIGPEVMVAALAQTGASTQAHIRLFITPGLAPFTRRVLAAAGLSVEASPDQPNVVLDTTATMEGEDSGPAVGHASETGRRQAFSAISAMADSACHGHLDVMVTGPVTKSIFDHIDPQPPGQTEFLAGRLGADRFAMMLAGPRLRVVPVTTHVPLRDVPRLLTTEGIVETSLAVHGDLQRWFDLAAPRLALCGLNPHAGEGGRLGDEEATIIAPAAARLRAQDVVVEGPMPADALFHQALEGRWDAVICMFHDQALGPLKTAHFGDAFNMTCGLSVPRLSPDHGTAFGLAGRGMADVGSARAALESALHIARRRAQAATTADVFVEANHG